MDKENIGFIVRYYSDGRFDVDDGWSRLGVGHASLWKKYGVAAAVAATMIVSATAAIIYNEYFGSDVSQSMPVVEVVDHSPLKEVKVIDFEEATLLEVVTKIEMVYGVSGENLPDQNMEYELSLHYEGTPGDLVAVINDILGTHMNVFERRSY